MEPRATEEQRRWNTSGGARKDPKRHAQTIEEKLKEIFADEFNLTEDEITRESRVKEDLGADSLDEVELAIVCEEVFSVDVPDDEDYPETFGGWVLMVERKVNASAG